MKLAISNIAWGQEDDEHMYAYMQKQGFTGLEIAPTRLFTDPYDNLPKAAETAEDIKNRYAIDIVSMQSICFGRDEQIFKNENERESLKDYVKLATDFAKAVNCPNMVFGSPKNRNIGEGQHDVAVSFFRELGVYAHTKSTVLAMEPNPEIYGTNFLNYTADAVMFVKEADCPGLKINLDFGTILANNEDVDAVAGFLPYVNHIHISEPFLEPIQPREEHKKLAALLQNAGYDKYISVEMKNTGNIDIVKEVMLYTKSIFG